MTKRVPCVRDWDTSALRDLPVGRRYLIGVSGGRDSVALLHWLQGHGYRKLIVCHLDHGLRGRAAQADARFVERLATEMEFPFVLASEDVKARARRSKYSLETAARVARYEFFARVARRRRCGTIFLGHHADDLAETFLFNLLRGSGSEGLHSLRAGSTLAVNNFSLSVVRPLLRVWRREIDDYVVAHRLRFREDATNQSPEPTRNRIRHRIIPMIEKEFGREVRMSLWRAAEIAAEESAILEELVPADLSAARNLPVAVQRRAVRRWLRENAVADVGFDLIEKVRALLDPANGVAKVNLPGDRHARRRAGRFFIEELPHAKVAKERKGKKPL
ncbi:MAG: tRNA lysidine(34) synthetase TilS [Chthoniobacterales bacterium]